MMKERRGAKTRPLLLGTVEDSLRQLIVMFSGWLEGGKHRVPEIIWVRFTRTWIDSTVNISLFCFHDFLCALEKFLFPDRCSPALFKHDFRITFIYQNSFICLNYLFLVFDRTFSATGLRTGSNLNWKLTVMVFCNAWIWVLYFDGLLFDLFGLKESQNLVENVQLNTNFKVI